MTAPAAYCLQCRRQINVPRQPLSVACNGWCMSCTTFEPGDGPDPRPQVPALAKGDRIMLICSGEETVRAATVLLTSPNGRSNAFHFEAIVGAHSGIMLTFQDDMGVHRNLATLAPVAIERNAPKS